MALFPAHRLRPCPYSARSITKSCLRQAPDRLAFGLVFSDYQHRRADKATKILGLIAPLPIYGPKRLSAAYYRGLLKSHDESGPRMFRA